MTAVIREAAEETGVVIAREDVHAAVTVHHRAPHGGPRLGVLFEVRRWEGTAAVREPAVCDAMGWYRLDALPAPMVAYCRAGLDAYRTGAPLAVHFQEPADPIAYDPATDRLEVIGSPAPNGPSAGGARWFDSPPATPSAPRTGTHPPKERHGICDTD
ncbi:NUDIX domain-containing protein [Streptomyces sp. NPDC003860]